MNSIKARAFAKVNLSLDVTGLREDGYHLMDMVNVSASLFDELEFVRTPGKAFSMTSNVRYLPLNEKNLVFKAAIRLSEHVGCPVPEVSCSLHKRIPSQAGLGGGSADAAAALICLNRMMEYGLSLKELCSVGEKVGADVPFCIIGGCARVQGIGEKITRFRSKSKYRLLIAMPRTGHSTKETFALIDSAENIAHPDTAAVIDGLKKGDLGTAFAGASNIFEGFVGDGETVRLKERLREAGAVYTAMTGTGAAVFGVFEAGSRALSECCSGLRKEKYGAWIASYKGRGVEIIPE